MARGTSIPLLRLPLVPDLLSLMKRLLHLVRGSKVVSLSIGCTRFLPLGYLRWVSSSASPVSAASIHSKAGVTSGRRRTVNRSSITPSPVGVIITLESLVRLSNPLRKDGRLTPRLGTVWWGALWWTNAPITLVTIGPTVTSAVICVLGCRLILDIWQKDSPLSDETEMISLEDLKPYGAKKDIEAIEDSPAPSYHKISFTKSHRATVSNDGNYVKVETSSVELEQDHITSRSDTDTLNPPPPTDTPNESWKPYDLEAGPSTSRLPYDEVPLPVTPPPLEPMTFATPTPPASPDCLTPELTPVRRRVNPIDEEDLDMDELDITLADQYDEDGRRRPPKRTHQKRWRSDELVPTSSFHPYAPTSSSPLNSRSYTTPSGRPLSSPVTPSAPFSPPSSSNASRHRRLSHLLHWPHPSRPTVPEEGDETPTRRSAVLTRPRSRTSVSSISAYPGGDRVSRLLTRQSTISRSSRGRPDSDVRTIASASTSWAFDNTHAVEYPDTGDTTGDAS